MILFRERSRRWWAGLVAGVVVVLIVGIGGPSFYRWAHARSAEKAATSMAAALGLRLTDSDAVVYSKVYTSFPDSSAFLIVESNSSQRAQDLRTDSAMTTCGPSDDDLASTPAQYRPPPSAMLTSCESAVNSHGDGILRAVWSAARGRDQRMFIWAIQT